MQIRVGAEISLVHRSWLIKVMSFRCGHACHLFNVICLCLCSILLK